MHETEPGPDELAGLLDRLCAGDREVAGPDRSSLLLARSLLGSNRSPGRRLQEQEAAQCVRQALAQLSEVDREVLLMRNADELSYEEVGCLLDIAPAAARKRYGRALLRLRQALIDHGLLEEPS